MLGLLDELVRRSNESRKIVERQTTVDLLAQLEDATELHVYELYGRAHDVGAVEYDLFGVLAQRIV